MTDNAMTIALSPDLYERLQRAAQDAEQPIERILAERLQQTFDDPLADLPGDEQAELKALAYLSGLCKSSGGSPCK